VPAEIHGIRFGMTQSTQLFQVHVSNPGFAQRRTECLAIELRIVAGARDRADVYHSLDAVRLEQCDEFFQGTRGVADGENCRLRVFAVGGHRCSVNGPSA
jgi:hypothetical protein